MEDDEARREAARENWRRITALWAWTGRKERDEQLFNVLGRYAPDAPLETLQRARLADPRGGGRMRESNARAIVGPLLGVDYGGDLKLKRPHSCLDKYRGPAPPDLLVHLRALAEHEHLDLAEQWVVYLRGGAEEPAPWGERRAGTGTGIGTGTGTGTEAATQAESEPETEEPVPPASRRVLIAAAVIGGVLAVVAAQALLRTEQPVRPKGPPALTAKLSTAPANPPDPQPAPAPRGTDIMRVSIEAERGGETFAISDGGRLQHGDRLAFYVETDEPLYAWVFQLRDDGRITLLYPPRADVLLQPSRKHRVPNLREGAFELDDKPGEERLLLVATNLPIKRDDAALKRLLEPLAQHPDWPKSWPEPSAIAVARPRSSAAGGPLGPLTVRTRNVTFVDRAPRSQSTMAAIVSAQFLSFDHQG